MQSSGISKKRYRKVDFTTGCHMNYACNAAYAYCTVVSCRSLRQFLASLKLHYYKSVEPPKNGLETTTVTVNATAVYNSKREKTSQIYSSSPAAEVDKKANSKAFKSQKFSYLLWRHFGGLNVFAVFTFYDCTAVDEFRSEKHSF